MGALGHPGDAAVQSRLADAATRCRALGVSAGILAPTPAMALRYLGYGYDWVAIGSDLGMMTSRAREWIAETRR
jgi:2-dehydro-3-deoxyglucarate aldolase/4-hydroxy-2-oxoheptanedioate aldolase